MLLKEAFLTMRKIMFFLTMIAFLLAPFTSKTTLAQEGGAQRQINLGLPIPGEGGATRTTTGIVDYATSLYNFARIIASILAVIMIIVGSLKYIFSGGNSEKVNDAKETIFSAIAGLLLLIFAHLFFSLLLPPDIRPTLLRE